MQTVEKEKKQFDLILIEVIIFISVAMSLIFTYDMTMYLLGDGFTFVLRSDSDSAVVQIVCSLLEQVKSIL